MPDEQFELNPDQLTNIWGFMDLDDFCQVKVPCDDSNLPEKKHLKCQEHLIQGIVKGLCSAEPKH